jgi:hypothetical protein
MTFLSLGVLNTNIKSNLSTNGLIAGIWSRSILSLLSAQEELTGFADAIITVGDLIRAFVPYLLIVNSPSSIASRR